MKKIEEVSKLRINRVMKMGKNWSEMNYADLTRLKMEYNTRVLAGQPGDVRDRIIIRVLEESLKTV